VLPAAKSAGTRNDNDRPRTEARGMKRRLFISGLFVALLALAFLGLFLRTAE
jgi:hypothetical protein